MSCGDRYCIICGCWQANCVHATMGYTPEEHKRITEYCYSAANHKYESRPCTVDLICTHAGYVALIQRGHDPDKGKWAFPGGFIDKESAEKAVIREFKEETGLDISESNTYKNIIISELKLQGIYSDYDRDNRHCISLVYHIEINDLHPLIGGDDASEAKWWKFEDVELQSDIMAFDHHKIFMDYLRIK